MALDQKVGTVVWSPLSGAKLGGKVGRNKTAPEGSRAASDASWEVPEDRLFAVTDVLEALSAETGRSIPQIALAWLLTRPTVSGIVVGARNAEQLRDNLGSSTLELSPSSQPARRGERAEAELPVLASTPDLPGQKPASGLTGAASFPEQMMLDTGPPLAEPERIAGFAVS